MNHDQQAADPKNHLVLVVDDHEDTRFMYREFLKLEGFRVEEAADGEQALECARSLKPQLVVMDVSLPGMSGLEVARIMRDEAALQPIRIVMLTGHHVESITSPGEKKAYDMVLTKPCMPDVLVNNVRTLLEGLTQLS